MNKGWIKLHRKILDNRMLANDSSSFTIFVALLLMVQHTDGSYDTGRFGLARFLHMNPSTVYKALKRLEAQGMITLQPNAKYTVITVCNWDQYQGQNGAKSFNAGSTESNSNGNTRITEENNDSGNSSRNSEVTASSQLGNTKQEVRSKNNITTNVVNKKTNKDIAIVEEHEKLTNEMIATFEEYLGIKLKQIPSQQRACRSIIRRLGAVKAVPAVHAAIACQDDKYAPAIANPVQLDKKLDNLLIYYKKQQNNNKGRVVGIVE